MTHDPSTGEPVPRSHMGHHIERDRGTPAEKELAREIGCSLFVDCYDLGGRLIVWSMMPATKHRKHWNDVWSVTLRASSWGRYYVAGRATDDLAEARRWFIDEIRRIAPMREKLADIRGEHAGSK